MAATAGGHLSAQPVRAVRAQADQPVVRYARAAILIDEATGRVLYQYNADDAFVPASLAKLMTLHIVLRLLDEHAIRRIDTVSLSANAWAIHQVPGSTVMHLGPGQIVTVEELMKGTAVASGNDAANALAEYAAGSIAEFVRLMNDEARFMGYATMHFTDPAGALEGNRVTAREFADFCRRYIELHPHALEELHSVKEFEYPLAQNMPDGRLPAAQAKKQYNANNLVWWGVGVDGLKTGRMDDENFTAAITARQGATRIIAVLLGVSGLTLQEGMMKRAQDTIALLSWGFRTYTTMSLETPSLPPVRVWKGTTQLVAAAPARPVELTARRDELSTLTYSMLSRSPLVAPVSKGEVIGELVYSAPTGEVARIPLCAAADVDSAGFLRRAWDTVALGLSDILDSAAALVHGALDTFHPTAVVSAESQNHTNRRTQ
jgi:serine-type D-Ala-D-Ala carboxypeptidase (penicillin-binding protein 5/6)